MAQNKLRVKDNAEGSLFVDSTCINCDACRRFAPSIFGDNGESSFVIKQPEAELEKLQSFQSLLACPVGCIGVVEKDPKGLKKARESFPLSLTENVFINGHNSEKSFGADSYFIKDPQGNWLVDSPNFSKDLVKKYEEMGGIKYIFLSHRDDVAFAHKFAEHFQAQRIIREEDLDAQPEAEIVLTGDEVNSFDKGEIHFTPGHTKGCQVLLFDKKYLFTGDHFAWLRRLNMFASFRKACWFSWEEQIKSVALMEKFENVEWVFPGHGGRKEVEKGSFPQIIKKAVEWMEEVR